MLAAAMPMMIGGGTAGAVQVADAVHQVPSGVGILIAGVGGAATLWSAYRNWRVSKLQERLTRLRLQEEMWRICGTCPVREGTEGCPLPEGDRPPSCPRRLPRARVGSDRVDGKS
jgi:hypothetical protein